MNMIKFVSEHYIDILKVIGSVIIVGQAVVRLTPTEKDDGFLTRVGKAYDSICDFLKIPNNTKGL